jgi:hypothetical protein
MGGERTRRRDKHVHTRAHTHTCSAHNKKTTRPANAHTHARTHAHTHTCSARKARPTQRGSKTAGAHPRRRDKHVQAGAHKAARQTRSKTAQSMVHANRVPVRTYYTCTRTSTRVPVRVLLPCTRVRTYVPWYTCTMVLLISTGAVRPSCTHHGTCTYVRTYVHVYSSTTNKYRCSSAKLYAPWYIHTS